MSLAGFAAFPNVAATVLATLVLLTACGRESAVGGATGDAQPAVVAANAKVAAELDLAAPQDFEDAARGLIARPSGRIMAADGTVAMDFDALAFVDGVAPPTVNPSLWRHARLNGQIGLFKVTDGIHQLRGFDISNMTLIDGASGWIVVDPLTSREAGAAAIAFARRHLGDKPVSGFIFTHSHLDHFGGVLGVISAAEAATRAVPVIAPGGFMEEATSENILVGLAMGRRSAFQFGRDLPRSPKGLVDAGLGRSVAYGTFGVLAPTQLVTEPTQEITVDGVRLVFHNVPGAEAPAELTFEVPERKAYCGAEILAQTIHNLLPVRGAKVRDAKRWSEYLDQALAHASGADVYFAQHNWPIWGRDRIAEFISKQRDVYRYTHDQAVRLINAGYTANEIAQRVQLPKSLASYFATRGYYGDLRHNVKAVYQFYLGFYDGNPAHLDPLPPEEAAARYIELAGGADAVVAAAREAFGRGEYRWAAELLNHVMFDTPERSDAADLLAQTYEQLGFMAEASTWRNSYLTAAQELRHGPPKGAVSRASMLDVIAQAPVENFLDAMAANLDGPAADGVNLTINLVLADTQQSWVLWLENAVLHHRAGPPAADANATLTLTKAFFLQMMTGTASAKDMLLSDDLEVAGSRLDLARFFSLFDRPTGAFAIVTK
jgi:alkyl sulfatase BDS1-like metallo-beta-lactamase superfamily hydrolase